MHWIDYKNPLKIPKIDSEHHKKGIQQQKSWKMVDFGQFWLDLHYIHVAKIGLILNFILKKSSIQLEMARNGFRIGKNGGLET